MSIARVQTVLSLGMFLALAGAACDRPAVVVAPPEAGPPARAVTSVPAQGSPRAPLPHGPRAGMAPLSAATAALVGSARPSSEPGPPQSGTSPATILLPVERFRTACAAFDSQAAAVLQRWEKATKVPGKLLAELRAKRAYVGRADFLMWLEEVAREEAGEEAATEFREMQARLNEIDAALAEIAQEEMVEPQPPSQAEKPQEMARP